MSYGYLSDARMGFSFRPPKWLRKAKVGKFLVPALAVGTLFIPGVGPAALAAAKAGGRGFLKAGKGLLPSFTSAAKSFAQDATQGMLTQAAQTFAPVQSFAQAQPLPGGESASDSPAVPAKGEPGAPSPIMPIVLVAGALLLLSSMKKGRKAA